MGKRKPTKCEGPFEIEFWEQTVLNVKGGSGEPYGLVLIA